MKTLQHTFALIFACITLNLTSQFLFAQGGQLAPGVDLNADGQAELLAANNGTVTVLDGATHAVIRTIAAPVANSGFGSAVMWLPDVNNDGFSDLAVLAPWNTTSASWGTVYIYSLATGALLSTTDAPATRHFGVTLKLVADQDSDSIPDLLVELQATGTQSRSALISTRAGTILTELPGTVSEMLNYVSQGGKLYAQSDIDGSGTVDLLDVAGFTGLVTAEDPRADLNHDGVIDTDDTLVMIDDSSQGIVTIAAQNFVSGQQGGAGPPENCLCTDAPASETSPCDGVSVSVSFPSSIRVGEPFQLTVTGVPEGGSVCAEIVQGNGLILNPSQSPISLVVFDSQSVCIRVKYTVMVGAEQCSKCTTVCLAAELVCPVYTISLRCPTFSDLCPTMVSANAINTVFAVVSPEGSAVYWEIEDPLGLVEWSREYPTQLKFRTKNLPGTFTVQARYGPENGPCPPGYADCVITVDPDTDGDGLSDFWENMQNHCTDPNLRDTDDDGVWDGAEIAMGSDPCNPNSTPAMIDSDRDGLTDIEEYQTYHTDPHLFDTDGDNVQDYAEIELARLGVFNGMDPLRAYSLAEGNTALPHAFDGYQASYYLAWDKDRDGLFDPWELAMGLDPTQVDQDGDGIGDGLEMRPRLLPQLPFGGPRYVPARSVSYPEDGARGGETDADQDWDGITDAQEEWLGTDAWNPDSDGDGVLDGDESRLGLNPSRGSSSGDYTSDGAGDIDGDGLANGNESRNGGLIDDADTDGDGVSDGAEVGQGSMPDSGEDGGRPRTQLEEDSNFVALTITGYAADGKSMDYPHWCTSNGHTEWSFRYTGGRSMVRVGPCSMTVSGVMDHLYYTVRDRTIFLTKGKKHNFSGEFMRESWVSEYCSRNPITSEPIRWRATGTTCNSHASLGANGAVFTPRGTVGTSFAISQIGFDALWPTIRTPRFGPTVQHTETSTYPPGSSRTFSDCPPLQVKGSIYIPRVEFFDLRYWSPTLHTGDEARAHALSTGETFGTYTSSDSLRYLRIPNISPSECTPSRKVDGAVTDGVSGCVVKISGLPELPADFGPLPIVARNASSPWKWEPDVVGEFFVPHSSGWLPQVPLTVPGSVLGSGYCSMEPFYGDPDPNCPWETAFHPWSAKKSGIGSNGIGLYFPPPNFLDADSVYLGNHLGTQESATLDVTFKFAGQWRLLGTVKLHRPPIVLVHGILSDASAWYGTWSSAVARTRVYHVDYGPTSHLGFPENVVHLQPVIDGAIDDLRTGVVDGSKYAATQVDMVGHSQGGQLIRWYVANTDEGADALALVDPNIWESEPLGIMRRPNGWPSSVVRRSMDKTDPLRRNCRVDNYYSGDIRRFVTVGSPFLGSPLADVLEPVLRPTQANVNRLIALFSAGPPLTQRNLGALEAIIGAKARNAFGNRIFAASGKNPFAIYHPPTCAADLQTGAASRVRSVLSASFYSVDARDNWNFEDQSPYWFPVVGTMAAQSSYPWALVGVLHQVAQDPMRYLNLPLNELGHPTLNDALLRVDPILSDLIVETGSQSNHLFDPPTFFIDQITHSPVPSFDSKAETQSPEIRDEILRRLRLRPYELVGLNGNQARPLFMRGGLKW